jgi:cation transport ATPase
VGEPLDITDVPARETVHLQELTALFTLIKPYLKPDELPADREHRHALEKSKEEERREISSHKRSSEVRTFWAVTAVTLVMLLFTGGVIVFMRDLELKRWATTAFFSVFTAYLGFLLGKGAVKAGDQ